MWDPGFRPAAVRPARLFGWRRSFCMWSWHYRGTVESPGLVLALDRAGEASCEGLALRVAEDEATAVLAALRARELVSDAYLETLLPVAFPDGCAAEAVTYVIAPDHVQHCRGLGLEEQARIIAAARGERGWNRDYLANTADHLARCGITDPDIDWLAARVRALSRS